MDVSLMFFIVLFRYVLCIEHGNRCLNGAGRPEHHSTGLYLDKLLRYHTPTGDPL